METAVIKMSDLAYLLGFIISVWAVIKIWKEIKKPDIDTRNRVDKHAAYLENDKKLIQQLQNDQKELEMTNKMICKCLLAMMDHEIDGNSVEKLKQTRDDLREFIVDKG